MKNNVNEKTNLPNVKKIIIVASGKGGVGKSTVAAGLALSLAREGFATGLLDADIYGPSIPLLFGFKGEHPKVEERDGKSFIEPLLRFGIKIMSIGFFIDPNQPVLWRGPLASNSLMQLVSDTNWGNLDYLIIDTPPGTGDIHLTILQRIEVNGVIIVTTPQQMAISDVRKAVAMFKNDQVGVYVYGIVENMSWFTPTKHPEEKYFIFGKDGGKMLANEFNVPLLAQIPVNESICGGCDSGHLNEIFIDKSVHSEFDEIVKALLNAEDVCVK